MNHKYDDIIDLPHPKSLRHPPMSIIDRAAQFSPFSALVGYEDAIAESGRLTQRMGEADGNEIELLDRKLRYLREHPGTRVTLTYFSPDERKSGGDYFAEDTTVLTVDPREQLLITETKAIPLRYLRDLQIACVDL